MLEGITITLYEKTITGEDDFGRPVEEETPVEISNVLVAPVSGEDVINELNLSGKHVVYQLALPKGDAHTWEDARVDFFGESWRVVGTPLEGIESLIPGAWNRKVKVERYE